MISTFVLSPGRCGTQWLTNHFAGANPERRVLHEPLHFDYAPLDNSPRNPLNKNRDILLQHLAAIEGELKQGKPYMECGFPCWRHLNWFRQALSGPVRIIYIHRDPVANAASLLKLNAFVPSPVPCLGEKQLFHPSADGAGLSHYGGHWDTLTPFEKCLYYWAEVNLQAAQYMADWDETRWLTIPYHELFKPDTLTEIAEFAQLESALENTTFGMVDNFGGIPQAAVWPEAIYRHPGILALARSLGYDYPVHPGETVS